MNRRGPACRANEIGILIKNLKMFLEPKGRMMTMNANEGIEKIFAIISGWCACPIHPYGAALVSRYL